MSSHTCRKFGGEAIFVILIGCTVLSKSMAQEVQVQYGETCYEVGDTMEVTASYNGIGTVRQVDWSYSNVVLTLGIDADCVIFGGTTPTGFPDSSRLNYQCPNTHSLGIHTYKLTLSSLTAADFGIEWGATFNLQGVTNPAIVKITLSACAFTPPPTTTSTPTTSQTSITSTTEAPTATTLTTNSTTTDSNNNTDKNNDIVIIASSCGGVLLIIVIGGVVYKCRSSRSSRAKNKHSNGASGDIKAMQEIAKNEHSHSASGKINESFAGNKSHNTSHL